jgi:hypothetical protein
LKLLWELRAPNVRVRERVEMMAASVNFFAYSVGGWSWKPIVVDD